MSLDRSLRSASSLSRHRNVLKRDERLKQLKEEERWTDAKGPFGLPKVAHRKAAIVKTVKEEVAADGTAVAGAAAPAAAGAKPAAGAKAAAPAAAAPAAKGGKAAPAAPAAKGKK